MARMADCKRVLSLLPRELSGEICDSDVQQISAHLTSCLSCSIAYESARETVKQMSGTEFGAVGTARGGYPGFGSGGDK